MNLKNKEFSKKIFGCLVPGPNCLFCQNRKLEQFRKDKKIRQVNKYKNRFESKHLNMQVILRVVRTKKKIKKVKKK